MDFISDFNRPSTWILNRESNPRIDFDPALFFQILLAHPRISACIPKHFGFRTHPTVYSLNPKSANYLSHM